ncbi:uncharacterized protein LOC117169850 [Belonocnema kinseyi]|uniref:uncharacterized protein LOC117169850 n=1 Tax=Belonocnema kinseyi TaxID=2817044 RepID=UPI00143DADC0|nr:uncharacterized protein LOC117169850 [Belonocnema kinseyi]
MAIRITIILLICAAGCALAQFSDENVPHRGTNAPRRFKPQTPRITPTAQSVFVNQRFRRPIPLKSRPTTSSEITSDVSLFTPGGGGRGLRPQALSKAVTSDSEEVQSQQNSNSEIKPVSEDNEREEDLVEVISNLGAVSSFPSTSSNLVTPAPQPSPVQYRPLPAISVTRPTPTQEQNIAPVQYRPHKQKPQKATEDIPEGRSAFEHTSVPYRPKQLKQQKLTEEVPEARSSHDHSSVQFRFKPQKSQKVAEDVPESRSAFDQTAIQYRSKPVKQQKYVDDAPENRPNQRTRPQIPVQKQTAETDYYTSRLKKPVAQVIRRYREETDDGSIVWGFENDDGSYKEEVIGIDCITRGKYGYVDPDGLRREYTYETGNKCEEEEQQQDDILNTFVDYQENKLVLPSGKTIDLSTMGKKQLRRPQFNYRN